jgi:ornithine cyclodeaminase/alanine dehydrogenase-like protein (mu-crystallin family)
MSAHEATDLDIGGADAPAWFGRETVARLLTPSEAADALALSLQAMGEGPTAPIRTVVRADAGELLTMPTAGPEGAGAKVLGIAPGNPARGLPLIQGVFVLFSAAELRPIAVLDGAALTDLRTPAVSVLAARVLAREDAERLVVFGAGVQARAHAAAIAAIRPIRTVTVVARPPAAADFVEELRRAGLEAEEGDAGAVDRADIVCTCTTSAEPLFDGAAVAAGAHVSAMGSYRPSTREIDEALLRRATVILEDRQAVLAEAGDLLIPLESGDYDLDRVAGDLRSLATGAVGRSDHQEITVFKSVGVAWEDLVVARACWDRFAAVGDERS